MFNILQFDTLQTTERNILSFFWPTKGIFWLERGEIAVNTPSFSLHGTGIQKKIHRGNGLIYHFICPRNSVGRNPTNEHLTVASTPPKLQRAENVQILAVEPKN